MRGRQRARRCAQDVNPAAMVLATLPGEKTANPAPKIAVRARRIVVRLMGVSGVKQPFAKRVFAKSTSRAAQPCGTAVARRWRPVHCVRPSAHRVMCAETVTVRLKKPALPVRPIAGNAPVTVARPIPVKVARIRHAPIVCAPAWAPVAGTNRRGNKTAPTRRPRLARRGARATCVGTVCADPKKPARRAPPTAKIAATAYASVWRIARTVRATAGDARTIAPSGTPMGTDWPTLPTCSAGFSWRWRLWRVRERPGPAVSPPHYRMLVMWTATRRPM